MAEKKVQFTVKRMTSKQLQDEIDRLKGLGFTRNIKKSRSPAGKKLKVKKETQEERNDFLSSLIEVPDAE
jgi:peptide deformylase